MDRTFSRFLKATFHLVIRCFSYHGVYLEVKESGNKKQSVVKKRTKKKNLHPRGRSSGRALFSSRSGQPIWICSHAHICNVCCTEHQFSHKSRVQFLHYTTKTHYLKKSKKRTAIRFALHAGFSKLSVEVGKNSSPPGHLS